jgi:hypothetical protein
MGVDVRAHLDLLDLDDLLLLALLGGLLLVLILQLAQIEDLADRRFRVRRDFDEVETRLFGKRQSFIGGNDAEILAFIVDELDFGNANVPIGARALAGRCAGFERSANGRVLLKLLQITVE